MCVLLQATEDSPARRSTDVMLTLYVYNEWPTTPAPPTTTSEYVNVNTDTQDDNKKILLVEIIVPVAVVVLVVVLIIIVLVRRYRLKFAENVYDVKKQETKRSTKLHHSHDATIESLSTSQLNAYDMINAYAQMPTSTFSGSVETNAHEDVAVTNRSTYNVMYSEPANQDEDKENTSDVMANGSPRGSVDGLYSIVDKRKQRKRVVANLDEAENDDGDVISNDVNDDAPYDNVDCQSLADAGDLDSQLQQPVTPPSEFSDSPRRQSVTSYERVYGNTVAPTSITMNHYEDAHSISSFVNDEGESVEMSYTVSEIGLY